MYGRTANRPSAPAECRWARQAPLADTTPIRAGLGSGRSPRPEEVLFLLNEDTRLVEKIFTVRVSQELLRRTAVAHTKPEGGAASP